MSSPALEAFLARLYSNASACDRFLAAPAEEAARAGLSREECAQLANIDRVGLRMASAGFARKRMRMQRRATWTRRWRNWWTTLLRRH